MDDKQLYGRERRVGERREREREEGEEPSGDSAEAS